MNRVLDRLWIGTSRDADGTTPLASLGFVAVVDLCDKVPDWVTRSVFHLSNRDGDPWTPAEVEECLGFIGTQVRKGKVLVVCAAGMSRSASMVIGYLVSVGMSAVGAHELVKRARPCVAAVPSMVGCVLKVAVRDGNCGV